MRGEVPVLAATVNPMVPEPEPDAEPSVIQASPVVAVQAQPAPAVIPMVPMPPAAGSDWPAGVRL